MANVINLQFSDKIEGNQHYAGYTGTVGDNTDIGYFIGSANGTMAYSNIFTSGEVTSTIGPAVSANTFNRVNLESATFTAGPHDWDLTNYTVSLDTLVIWHENNTSSNQNFEVRAYDERVNAFVTVGSFSSNSTSEVQKTITITMDFYTDQFEIHRTSGSTSTEITEIYMYGWMRRKNGNSLGLLTPPAIVEDLNDMKIDTTFEDGWVEYEGWMYTNYRHAYETSATTLTGNYTIGSGQQSNVVAINPNGSPREVYLPIEPKLDMYWRVINTDGSNALTIKEYSGGPTIVELSNATTILSAEFIWEETDEVWHATF